jgi:hypothetical protein
MSRACGQAPEAEKIRFEDEHESQGTADFELKCKKCRYVWFDERVSISFIFSPSTI